MKVENRKCICRLAFRSFMANRRRNLIAIAAIILTAVLFTTLFTILMSIKASYETSCFREIGGYEHGSFKHVTDEDIVRLGAHRKIKEWGLRTIIGMNSSAIFKQRTAEVSYMDDNVAKWSFIKLKEGRMPVAKNEVVMDTAALACLGIKPVVGAEVKIPFGLGLVEDEGANISETFVLSGYWEFDTVCPAHYVNVSKAYLEEIEKIVAERGMEPLRTDMNILLRSSVNIEDSMATIAIESGYDIRNPQADNYMDYGINPGYLSISATDTGDAGTVAAILAFSLLVAFTGYLIIYNVFQISVSGDIKYYGLLKTIGVTSAQLKTIIRLQALALCAAGIPIGLLAGYGLGAGLTGLVLEQSAISGSSLTISTSPLIFAAAAVFELITVLLSTAKPGRSAAKVSPVEALRYTEGAGSRKKSHTTKGAKVWRMALANMGRNRKKTILVFVSLALAIVLLNSVFLFTGGFSSEKWLAHSVTFDFVLGKNDYFKDKGAKTPERGVEKEDTEYVKTHTRTTSSGFAYDTACYVNMLLDEETYNEVKGLSRMFDRGENGEYYATAFVEAMDDELIDRLTVYEGDADLLKDESGRYIAFITYVDEEGNIIKDACAPAVGEKVTLSYAKSIEAVDTETGLPPEDGVSEHHYVEYHFTDTTEFEYTVAAYVGVPTSIGPRRMAIGANILMGSDTLAVDIADQMVPMLYAFDVADIEAENEAEAFVKDFCADPVAEYMYESKAVKRREFDEFKNMFMVLGGILCGIIGIVGMLNFFNAVMAGIITRKNELAVLEAIGMTGKQVKEMLITEGIIYAVGSGVIALLLSLVLTPVLNATVGNIFWFYSAHFSVTPVLMVMPLMALLGVCIPLMSYRGLSKASIVDRIREIG